MSGKSVFFWRSEQHRVIGRLHVLQDTDELTLFDSVVLVDH